MIHLQNIRKTFDRETALDDISLEIAEGQLTVLIGPSGCGKSTLLKLIMGLMPLDRGVIQWRDPSLDELPPLQRRRKMGYVIQEGGLFPHLTAENNITLVARFLKWDESSIRARLQELSSLVQLDPDLLRKYPLQLSGGQRQRIGLMRALFLDPELLLLDEPLGALDPLVRFDLQQDLKAIFQKLGKTVIMVTHDMGEAAYFADRIVLMQSGRIVQIGTLRELIDSPADPFVSQFIHAQRPLSVLAEAK